MGQANINRGEKWTTERAKAVFENRSKDVEWIDSQEAIVADMKEFENSKVPEVKVKEKK